MLGASPVCVGWCALAQDDDFSNLQSTVTNWFWETKWPDPLYSEVGSGVGGEPGMDAGVVTVKLA